MRLDLIEHLFEIKKQKMKQKIKHIFITILTLTLFSCNLSDKPTNEKESPTQYGQYNNIDADGYMNLRQKPSSNSEILRKIPVGEKFIILDYREKEWSRVQTITNEVGYVKSDRIQLENNPKVEIAENPFEYKEKPKSEQKPKVKSENYQINEPKEDLSIVGSWYDETNLNEFIFFSNKSGIDVLTLNGTFGSSCTDKVVFKRPFNWTIKNSMICLKYKLEEFSYIAKANCLSGTDPIEIESANVVAKNKGEMVILRMKENNKNSSCENYSVSKNKLSFSGLLLKKVND